MLPIEVSASVCTINADHQMKPYPAKWAMPKYDVYYTTKSKSTHFLIKCKKQTGAKMEPQM